jgi:Asp-tRNA(Asn)/Glu-tRNA(Gln) amidotransferase A subunit family amidase
MAANMIDLEVAWRTMAQPDPDHHISRQFPMPSRPSPEIIYPKRIGIDKKWFDRADAGVKAVCQKAVDYYRDTLGYEIIDISIPHLREAQMAHALTILNEVTSSIKRSDLKKLLPPNQILLTVGAKASCADFLAAQRIRTMVMEHLAFLFKKYPGLIIVTPTTPNAGWPIHKKDKKYGSSDGNRSIRNMEYVWLANFAGVPSISLPVGFVDPVQGEGKFPIGLMGAGEWGSEDQLLQFGYEGEKYLNEVYEGGRLKPKHWLDVFALVEEAAKGKTAKIEAAEKDETKQVIADGAIKEKSVPDQDEKAVVTEEQTAVVGEKEIDATRTSATEAAEVNSAEDPKVESVDEKVADEIKGTT